MLSLANFGLGAVFHLDPASAMLCKCALSKAILVEKEKSMIDEKKLRCERKELVSPEKKYLLGGEIATHGLL